MFGFGNKPSEEIPEKMKEELKRFANICSGKEKCIVRINVEVTGKEAFALQHCLKFAKGDKEDEQRTLQAIIKLGVRTYSKEFAKFLLGFGGEL